LARVTDLRSSTAIRPGDIVAGKYRVDRVLGEGGMGVVVAATHEHLGQKVALKFLLPEMAANPEIVQRFLREARAAVQIHSEHVARVLDVGTQDGAPYMVMEYLEGGDVARVLAERGALPVSEAVGYVLQACEAIAEAHSLGIVHRDLKPANLFLAKRPTGKPSVKVLDFGISKAPATAGDANLTKTSAIMGSPSYMSPEQLVSSASVDVRCDVWALGVVLYEMLAHAVPFLASSMPELVAAILQKNPQPLAAVRAGVPPGLDAVVDRCLQKDPARRYPNVAELARALLPFAPSRSEESIERIEHVLGVSREGGVPASVRPGASLELGAASSTFSPATSRPAAPRNRKILFSTLFGAVASGSAVAMFLSLRGPKPSADLPQHPAALPAEPMPTPEAGAVALVPAEPPSSLVVNATRGVAASESSKPTPSAARVVVRPSLPSAHPQPSAAPEPTCRTVSYFDSEGNKHFRQECQ
jgi:serine/threonine-protein kinase